MPQLWGDSSVIWIIDLVRNGFRLIANLLTRLSRAPLDYVVVELAGTYPERTGPRPPLIRRLLPSGAREAESLEALRARLDRISRTPRVRGVVLRMRDLEGGGLRSMATIQSLRLALADVRRRGKRVVAYLPEARLADYYLAAAADEIWMANAGMWQVTGVRAEVTFYRAALDRIGLLPEFERIAEYKTAADPFMRTGMSEHHREVLESVLDAILAEVVRDLAASRRLDVSAVRAAIDRAPLTAAQAQAAGLINGTCYEDELPVRLGSVRTPAALVPWPRARRRLPLRLQWRGRIPLIGVVELIGGIVPGESRDLPVPIPLLGGRLSGSETIARAFRAAERDPRVRAIIFYIDSGGGSALASDLICREVERIKARKPVVALMGNVAGSGGYYVACQASRIIAQPATLTGSIGVISGKMSARGLYSRLGLNREIVSRGDAAVMDSPFQPYSPDHWDRMRREARLIYQRFVARVAGGRHKTEAEVEAIARGRVWTGRQALEHGLIDDLGDFGVALRHAKALAGIREDRDAVAVTIRAPRSVPVPHTTPIPSADGSLIGVLSGVIDGLRELRQLADEGVWLIMPH